MKSTTKPKELDPTLALAKKLNLPPTGKAKVLHAPAGYNLPGTHNITDLNDMDSDIAWIQSFYDLEADLTHELPSIKEHLAKQGILWLCWPKRSVNKGSGLNDTIVRSLGLACGLVDTKVASINDVYSGLKFVYRLKDR